MRLVISAATPCAGGPGWHGASYQRDTMDNRNEFYRIAHLSQAGLTELGATLAVAHCTVPEITGLITTAEQKSAQYDAVRHGKRQAFVTLRSVRVDARTYIEKARNHLTAYFGTSWNESWAQIGFADQELKLPATDARRQRILAAMRTYFSAHLTHENTTLSITALEAEVRLGALNAAMATARDCRVQQRTKRDERDTAEEALHDKLQVLRAELDAVLTPTDPRWLNFIDRIPGDPRTPEPVDEVTAQAQPGGIITLDWEDSTRAARYKVLKQVVGVDAELVLALTVDDSDAELTGLPAGATVKLQIVATNAVGDAPPSAVIQLQAA